MHEQREMTTVQVKVNKWEPLEGTKAGEVSHQRFRSVLRGSRSGRAGLCTCYQREQREGGKLNPNPTLLPFLLPLSSCPFVSFFRASS